MATKKARTLTFDLDQHNASEVLRTILAKHPSSPYKIAKRCGLGLNPVKNFLKEGTDARASTTDPLWAFLKAKITITVIDGDEDKDK